jgi:hypothetical protein
MAAVAYEPLELFLTQCGLAWSPIQWERHCGLSNDWEALYGNEARWLHRKQGAKAQYEYTIAEGEAT